MNETGNRRRNEYLPYVLIAAGLLVLLANVGWFSFGGLISTVVAIAQLWPVVLIALGVDMLLGGKHRAIVVAVALVIGAALLLSEGVRGVFGGASGTSSGGHLESVSVPLRDAQSTHIELDSGVGRVVLGVARGSQMALEGTVQPARGERFSQTVQMRGSVLEIDIDSRTSGPSAITGLGGRGGEWRLDVSDRVPVTIDYDGGVGESILDLRGLDLTGLDLDAGVGAVQVTLPESGNYEASIDAGVGEVTVRVPDGASVRFSVSTGLGGVSVAVGFERPGNNVYFSPGYSTSGPSANVSISGGVGAISLETIR